MDRRAQTFFRGKKWGGDFYWKKREGAMTFFEGEKVGPIVFLPAKSNS